MVSFLLSAYGPSLALRATACLVAVALVTAQRTQARRRNLHPALSLTGSFVVALSVAVALRFLWALATCAGTSNRP